MSYEKIDEMIRERISGGSGCASGIEEVLLLQLLTNNQNNQQGGDLNSLLPLLLLTGGGVGRRGRIDKLALVALIASQQQAQTSVNMSGGSPQPSNNMLPLLLALGLFGEEREGAYPSRRYWKTEEEEDEVDALGKDVATRSKKVRV
jgi:hypothetical protein